MTTRAWIICLVAAALAGALFYFNRDQGLQLPDDIAFGNGRVEGVQIDIVSRIAGRVETVDVIEGELIEPGQQVATIDTRLLNTQLASAKAQVASAEAQIATAEANVRQAQATLALAALTLERTRALTERGANTEAQLETHESEHAVAEANLQAAVAALQTQKAQAEVWRTAVDEVLINIEDTTLTAIRPGRVLYRLVEPGEMVTSGSQVVSMVDLGNVYLEFYLSSLDAHRIAIGNEARITFDIAPDFVTPAQVSFISPVSQFTPSQVETEDTRADLVFRVRVRVAEDLVKEHIQMIKTGMRAVVYVRLTSSDPTPWPEFLTLRLPPLEE